MSEVSQVKKARSEYLDQLKEKIQKSTDESHQYLLSDDSNGRLPEELFVNYFLPYFSGAKSISENNDIIKTWISIAGNPTAEVAILDKNMNVLFKVPPLFDTGILKTIDTNSRKLSTIYHNYSIRKNNMPMTAENFLESAMEEKNKSLISNVVNHKYQKQWQDIFDRYNINKKTTTTKDIDDLDEDFFDFS